MPRLSTTKRILSNSLKNNFDAKKKKKVPGRILNQAEMEMWTDKLSWGKQMPVHLIGQDVLLRYHAHKAWK